MKKLSTHTIIKALFLVFALISLALLYTTAINYTNVMDARVNIPRNVWIQDVMIPEIGNENNNTRVSVLFNITNPTNIDIYIYDLSFELYMDDVDDNPMDRGKPDTWDDWAVGLGGFLIPSDQGIEIPRKGQKSILANKTVIGDTMSIRNLNTTDFNGKYHPLIIASMRYTFKDLDVKEVVHGIYFYSKLGISPSSTED